MSAVAKQESEESLSYENIVHAYNRISPVLMTTPVHFSTTFNKLVGKQVYFKCENLQKTGAFKARGALNAVLAKLSRESNVNKYKGCITHSSGNHGQALAWACNHEKVPCTVVLPSGKFLMNTNLYIFQFKLTFRLKIHRK